MTTIEEGSKRFVPTATPTTKTLELLRKYKRIGMTERTCKYTARCVERWQSEYFRLHLSEQEIDQRAENWVEMFRKLKV
jgi:hypothetical protein